MKRRDGLSVWRRCRREKTAWHANVTSIDAARRVTMKRRLTFRDNTRKDRIDPWFQLDVLVWHSTGLFHQRCDIIRDQLIQRRVRRRAFRRTRTFVLCRADRRRRGLGMEQWTLTFVVRREFPEASFTCARFFLRSRNFDEVFIQREIMTNWILRERNQDCFSFVVTWRDWPATWAPSSWSTGNVRQSIRRSSARSSSRVPIVSLLGESTENTNRSAWLEDCFCTFANARRHPARDWRADHCYLRYRSGDKQRQTWTRVTIVLCVCWISMLTRNWSWALFVSRCWYRVTRRDWSDYHRTVSMSSWEGKKKKKREQAEESDGLPMSDVVCSYCEW